MFMWELEGQLALDGQRGRNGYLGEEIGRGGNEERCGSRKKEKWIQEPVRTAATGRLAGEGRKRGASDPSSQPAGASRHQASLQQGGGGQRFGPGPVAGRIRTR